MTSKIKVQYYGTLRCHSATHQVSSALTNRGYHDLPNMIVYNPKYRGAMRQLGIPRGHGSVTLCSGTQKCLSLVREPFAVSL